MAKVDPYLRPLYDALYDMVEPEGAQRLLERQTVEVAPLAFMRGRTLNASFIILDEAQNTTPEQMKMFLTRIGFGSKAVITGDTTQVDVAGGRSGLQGLERILEGIDGLGFVHLTGADVVRHRIVADIVAAYERADGLTATGHACPAGNAWAARATRRCSSPTSRPRCRSTPARWARLAEAVLAAEGVRGHAELSLLFVGEDDIAALNEQFLGNDAPDRRARLPDRRHRRGGRVAAAVSRTGPDRSPDDPGDLPLLLGDVVLCPAVAARQAAEHAGTLDDELALLVVHGVLHILGHDHAEPERGRAHAGTRARAARGPPLGRPGAGRLPPGAAVMVLASEFGGTELLMLVAIIVLLLVLAFFAVAETALNRISRVRARHHRRGGALEGVAGPGRCWPASPSCSSTRSS